MFVSRSIGAEHKDLIQDVAYDFHGKRMATCSCDQYVKIWDLVSGEWKCTSGWKCHTGSVWRVSWAHPEFGQVIATCSFDRTAVVWEELVPLALSGVHLKSRKPWTFFGQLSAHGRPDPCLMQQDCPDEACLIETPTVNLKFDHCNFLPLIQNGLLIAHMGNTPSLFYQHSSPSYKHTLLKVDFELCEGKIVSTTESSQNCRWVKRGNLVDSRTSVVDVKFGPKHLGLILATCSVDGAVRIYEATDVMNLNVWNLAYEMQCQVATSCISWSTARCFPPTIAVGSDDTQHTGGRVQIYEFSDANRKYVKVEVISTILDPVRDVAFCPNLGRSYHMLAVASKDVHLLTLKPLNRIEQVTSQDISSTKFEVRCVGQFSDHQSQVWRLSWNITGTILASSGDDGYVRLWKGNYMDHWKCIAEIKGDSADAVAATNAPVTTTL